MADEIEIEALEREAAEIERAEAEKSKSSKKDTKKKKKTANRLDERFQIGPEHDPDHIFEEEMEMITRLRSEIEDLRFYSDKWVCYFLFSRRHDYNAVKDLLQKYLKTRADFGWRTCSPIFTEDSLRADRFMYRPQGVVDKEGRMILWLYLGGARPHGRKFQDLMGYAMWEVDYVVETETLAQLRNGFVWVIDLTNFSLLKNADLSSDGRKWTAAVSGALPNRVRSIWIMKAGWMFRAIMAAAKLLFPKKMTKRFKMITEADLQELVPRNVLVKDYGGEKPLDFEDMWAKHDEVTKRLRKRWKKIRKQLDAEGNGANIASSSTAETEIVQAGHESLRRPTSPSPRVQG